MKTDYKSFAKVERMLKFSQTKLITPIITWALVRRYLKTGKADVTDPEIRTAYNDAVQVLTKQLGHNVHFGAKYYDAYGSRMSRHGVLRQTAHLKYELLSPFTEDAAALSKWIPQRIAEHIGARLGVVPSLGSTRVRASLADKPELFLDVVMTHIDKTPANFEIFSFAILKVHLEKFACKIYRDTRTAAHDQGVDLSTNFGVVYQLKKLRVYTETEADKIYAELQHNFDAERIQDGNVVVVIDEVSKEMQRYLIDMRVQSLSKAQVVALARNFDEPEDRQKVLRVVYDEFRREYSSRIS